jgi:hypothetical protein
MAESNHAGDYNIISVMVHSHMHEKPINIAAHVSEIEIYENIELPYLTGTFNMKDDLSMYDTLISWNGTEMIDIAFESPENIGNFISKRFTVAEIVDTAKATENIEGLEIKILETNCFNNNMMQINNTYTGTPEQIIKKILKDNLDMEMEEDDMPGIKSYQEPMKFVVPFINPFEACEVIRSRMSTDLGLPYFLYSTLNTRNVQLKSLEEMLRTPSINKVAPYRFSQSFNQSTVSVASEENLINVSAYSSGHKQNSLSLMASGSTAGQHSITNITTGQTTKYTFDVDELFRSMMDADLIKKGTIPVHHSKYEFNNKMMNKYNTKNVHRAVMNDTYTGINNIHQAKGADGFRLAACNNALRNMLFKTSMNIRVPGRLYLIGSNASLGRQIDFIYPSNNTLIEGSSNVTASEVEDKKRSGVFIIYTARHHFNDQQHNVDMSCVKLGNRK